jgi:hypothetical protein
MYGGTGTGKTISALTFPKPAYIDLEGGVDWYIGRQIIPEQNVDFLLLQTESAMDVINAVEEIKDRLADDPDSLESVVIDPISVFWDALQEGFIRRLQAKDKNAEIRFQHWKAIKAPYKRALTTLINLPVHLVLVGREAADYEMKKGELVQVGTRIQTEKDTPYISDIYLRHYKDKKDGVTRFMSEVEKDRTNMMKEGTHLQNLTFQHLLKLAEKQGLLESIKGAQTKVQSEVDTAALDAAVFDEQEASDETLQALISDEDIAKLWQELDWKPGKVLAMAKKNKLNSRAEIGKFLADKVREQRAS